ncbi:MAG: hypothetical protein ACO25K_04965 [Candidatus Fonsibacter ubiquis]
MNIVEPINQHRVEEKDKLIIQFFDKKRQITNEDLETVDVLDKNGNFIYDLYVEISNRDDPYSVVCKNVEKNDMIINVNGVKKRYKYNEVYKKAFEIYQVRKENKEKANDKDDEINRLKKELAKLQNFNKKGNKNKEENEIIQTNLE